MVCGPGSHAWSPYSGIQSNLALHDDFGMPAPPKPAWNCHVRFESSQLPPAAGFPPVLCGLGLREYQLCSGQRDIHHNQLRLQKLQGWIMRPVEQWILQHQSQQRPILQQMCSIRPQLPYHSQYCHWRRVARQPHICYIVPPADGGGLGPCDCPLRPRIHQRSADYRQLMQGIKASASTLQPLQGSACFSNCAVEDNAAIWL